MYLLVSLLLVNISSITCFFRYPKPDFNKIGSSYIDRGSSELTSKIDFMRGENSSSSYLPSQAILDIALHD